MRPRRRPPGLYVVQSACAGRSHDGARHELNLEFDDALARDAAAAHSDAKDVWHVVVVLPLFREVDAGDGAVFSVGADGDAEAGEEGVKGDGQLVLVEQQLGDHRSRVGDNVPHLVHLVGPAPAAEAVQVRLLAESLVRLLLDIAQPRHLLHRLACQLARDGSKGRHRLPRSQPCGGRRRQAGRRVGVALRVGARGVVLVKDLVAQRLNKLLHLQPLLAQVVWPWRRPTRSRNIATPLQAALQPLVRPLEALPVERGQLDAKVLAAATRGPGGSAEGDHRSGPSFRWTSGKAVH
mmetsp:Transcript_22737/g.66819  ORF Transcript_22737/g.66819 Transcript_22737/m.66819 type:complete len:294 (+) Transcript_22737:119-1000(+)